MQIGKPQKPDAPAVAAGESKASKRSHSGLSVNEAKPQKSHAKKALAMLKTHPIEELFEDKMARLDTTIPLTIKRDLNELLQCVNTNSVNSRNTSNRLIVEALRDLFIKYQKEEGDYQLVDDLHFKGRYEAPKKEV